MFNEQQQALSVNGLCVADCVVMLQLIARFTQSGQLKDVELEPVSKVRTRLATSVEETTGVNFDQARQAQQQALLQKMQEANDQDGSVASVSGQESPDDITETRE